MMRAAIVAALICGPALAECEAERNFVSAAIALNGVSVLDPGVLIGTAPCRLEGLSIDLGDTMMRFDAIEWTLSGVDAGSLKENVHLVVDIDDLRFNTSVPDRWVAYMLAEQNRRNTIDVRLDLEWQASEQIIEIFEFSVDLPRRNGLRLSSRASGVGASLLSGVGLDQVRLTALDVEIENTGFLDGVLLPVLIEQVRSVPGSPKSVMDATLAEVSGMIAGWPEAVFPGETRAELRELVESGPVPWGRVELSLRAPGGIGADRFVASALAGEPMGTETLATLFEGVEISADFESLDGED